MFSAKSKPTQVIWTLIALMAIAIWVGSFWFMEGFRTHKANEPHRRALLEIRDAIAIGASYYEVLEAYWQHRTDSLRLFADRPTDWIITMPMEFGASDWKLGIEFQDGKFIAVRIRPADGPPPRDGPKDIQKDSG